MYGAVQQVREIQGSTVVAQDGSRVDIKLVKAVPAASGQPETIEQENARTEQKKAKLYELMEALQEWLQGREMSLRSASQHLRATGPWDLDGEQVEYARLLRSQGFRVDASGGGLADAVRMFPDMLKLTRNALYIKRVQ